MNKQEFFKKLQNALRWTFTHEEIADILADYESFFVSGIKDGKGEHQICEELGEPSTIAMDLMETLGKKMKRPFSAKMIGRMVMTTTLLVIGIVFYSLTYQSWNIVRDSSVWFVVFAVVLWFTLGGTIKKLPPILRLDSRTYKWQIIVIHCILLSFIIGFFTLLIRINNTLLNEQNGKPVGVWLAKLLEKPEELGPMITFLLTSLTIIVIMFSIWSIYGFYRRSPQYFTVTCHTIGVIAYLGAAMNLLRKLSDPATFELSVLRLFIVYGVAIVLTFAFALLIHVRSRREK